MLVWCPASSLIERIGGGDRTTEAQRFTEKLRESQKGESSRTFSFFLSPSSSEVSAPLWCVHPEELEELPVSRRNQVSAGKLPADRPPGRRRSGRRSARTAYAFF